jgi:L-iditol 2-dehydrogenase
MRALVFTAPGQAEVTEAADRAAPGPGEVLVRSRVVGICHSDLELLAGRYIIPISYPITPGHEWSGEIAETGPGVTGLAPGDPVVGECVVGPGGRDHFGFSISGAAAEYFVARAEWLHKLPAQLSFGQGALVEPFSVAYNAVQAGSVDPADRVAVLGGGPIGLLTAMAAVGRGAQVVLIEPRPDRRAKAAELGVTTTIDPAAGDLVEQSREMTGGEAFDVVIESAGHPDAMAQALTITANRARVVYVGIDVGRTVPAELGLIQARSLRIQGIVGSAGLWRQAIRFLAAGVVDPSPVVTARYPLSAATDALAAASLGSGNIKVHIEAAG